MRQAVPGMHELLEIIAALTETVNEHLPQTYVLFAAFGCSSSSCCTESNGRVLVAA